MGFRKLLAVLLALAMLAPAALGEAPAAQADAVVEIELAGEEGAPAAVDDDAADAEAADEALFAEAVDEAVGEQDSLELEDDAPADEAEDGVDDLPADGEEGSSDGDGAEETELPEVAATASMADDAPAAIDNEALYEAYIESLLGVNGMSDAMLAQKVNGTKLTGLAGRVYDKLAPLIRQVAAGSRSSTRFPVSLSGIDTVRTPAQLGVSAALVYGGLSEAAEEAYEDWVMAQVGMAVDALRTDFPYELYWYNPFGISNGGYEVWYSMKVTASGGKWKKIRLNGSLELGFKVDPRYGAGNTVNGAAAKRAIAAAGNAADIVARYASASDYDKLAGYCDSICDLVEYNFDALDSLERGRLRYTDPWELIWAFDGDPSTNIVCEGYAKAFQYLCDLTDFDGNICCYCVTGYMGSGEDGGDHKWNIVSMGNRRRYLVDVTNCDGSGGSRSRLFMAGAAGSVDGGYAAGGLNYIYDDETRATYRDIELTLSERGWLEDGQAPVSILDEGAELVIGVGEKHALKANEAIVRYATGDKKKASVTAAGVVKGLKAGTTTITVTAADYVTEDLSVRVLKAPKKVKLSASKATLGVGQSKTLTAKLTPFGCRQGVTWSSSNPAAVVVEDGVVTAVGTSKKAVTITARSYNGKKATCKVTVKNPTSVKVSAPRTVLGLGERVQATAKLSKGSASDIEWTGTDGVLSVDGAGLVTATGLGKAVLRATAKSGGVYGELRLEIRPLPETIALNLQTLTLKKGKSKTLKATLPEGTAGAVTFTSDNPKVAKVSAAGKVTAKKKGTATITATCFDASATCVVTVK